MAHVYSHIEHVAPLYRSHFLARAIQPRYVSGAELYIDAEPHVSQAYLERILSCEAAGGGAGHPNDPLGAPNIEDVHVRAKGHHFVIGITGKDRASGKAIWQRAQGLVEASRIDVQQLSSAYTRADS